jgi:hypothetical protein
MRRRDFIAILAGGMAFPLVGRAQEPGRTDRLGFLVPPHESRQSLPRS